MHPNQASRVEAKTRNEVALFVELVDELFDFDQGTSFLIVENNNVPMCSRAIDMPRQSSSPPPRAKARKASQVPNTASAK